MGIFKPFEKLKRVISNFIETEYWYRFRKVPYCYFTKLKLLSQLT